MVVTITPEEQTILETLLTEALAEVRDEIYRTERYEFKENLRQRKTIIEQLLEKIQAESAVNTHRT